MMRIHFARWAKGIFWVGCPRVAREARLPRAFLCHVVGVKTVGCALSAEGAECVAFQFEYLVGSSFVDGDVNAARASEAR